MPYRAEEVNIDGVSVVRLEDDARRATVGIVPSVGNIAYEFNVGDRPVLWTPYHSPSELRDKPTMGGIPFLAPWANRLSGDKYWINGKEYAIDAETKNIRRDAFGHPIHGLVLFAPWTVLEVKASATEAHVTSQLDVGDRPDWLKQFPFPHRLTLTHSLSDGRLSVKLRVENRADQPLPLSMGFHPYFQVPGGDREACRITMPVQNRLRLNSEMLPTGEMEAWDANAATALAGHSFDDGFTNLVRARDGDAVFHAEGKGEFLDVGFGARFRVAVLYAPPGKPFLCFEPMTGITNAFNLAHEGKYAELQSVAPGGTWEDRFWVGVR
jgi:aldose 1-epimerase